MVILAIFRDNYPLWGIKINIYKILEIKFNNLNIKESELDFSFETHINSFYETYIFNNGYQYNSNIWIFNNYYKYNYDIPIRFKFNDIIYEININITDKRYSIIMTFPKTLHDDYLYELYYGAFWFNTMYINEIMYGSSLNINYNNIFTITNDNTIFDLNLILTNITNSFNNNLKDNYKIPESLIITFDNITYSSKGFDFDYDYVYTDYYRIEGSNIIFNSNKLPSYQEHYIFFEIYIENNRISDIFYNEELLENPYFLFRHTRPHITIIDNRTE